MKQEYQMLFAFDVYLVVLGCMVGPQAPREVQGADREEQWYTYMIVSIMCTSFMHDKTFPTARTLGSKYY